MKYSSFSGGNKCVKPKKYQEIILKNMDFILHGSLAKYLAIPIRFSGNIRQGISDLTGLEDPIYNKSLREVKVSKQRKLSSPFHYL